MHNDDALIHSPYQNNVWSKTVNCIFLCCRQSYKMHPLFVFNTEVQMKVLFSIQSNHIIINIARIKSNRICDKMIFIMRFFTLEYMLYTIDNSHVFLYCLFKTCLDELPLSNIPWWNHWKNINIDANGKLTCLRLG